MARYYGLILHLKVYLLFAKTVAHLVGAGTKGALYNGWRVVYCRGKVMDSYRKKYEKSIENHKRPDEIEESSESESHDDQPGEEEENNSPEPGEEDDDLDTMDSNKELHSKKDTDEEQEEDLEVFDHRNTDSYGSIRTRRNVISFPTVETISNGNSNNNTNEDSQSWWTSDSEDEDFDYYNSGLSIFGILDSFSPVNFEEEQDQLIMGDNEIFLDIGDKDFFNIINEESASLIPTSTEGETNHNSGIVICESVEDFYRGFDSDY